ncbi:helix-turn-helix transcriptional regulator [Paenibacillus tianmuensis]|uniref:helix-turn-helix transcriptional regulator n=1 Tax=Paenibacillus tianmuensis TaxID=624147 RepID=UPI0014301C41|nr:helix-turn-helix transcriptional regulator [Paenibacillus tianmuensis]
MARQGTLVALKAIIKLYCIDYIDQNAYGYEITEAVSSRLKPFGFSPHHSEVYRTLHEMADESMILRHERHIGPRQKVVYYTFTDDGRAAAAAYKKTLKENLDRSIALLNAAVADNYS